MAASSDEELVYKILVLGDAGVGKTSLWLRVTDGTFSEHVEDPDENPVRRKVFDNIEGHRVVLELWDTQGFEKFRNVTSSYYRGAHGALLVYDITAPATFRNVQEWAADVGKYANATIAGLLVANKCDEKAEVDASEQKSAAGRLNVQFGGNISAKTGEGVENAFRSLAIACVNRYNGGSKGKVVGANAGGQVKDKSRGCCLL